MQYRGRFAPSPTGPLHAGSLYTALASYLDARSRGGLWFLRVDDLDPLRTRADSTEQILRCLESLQLHWDGAVLYQSERLDTYQAALERLRRQGLIYPCTCSRRQLERHSRYPGTCRQAKPVSPPPHALRIRVPDRTLSIADELQGLLAVRLDQTRGDFIVYRRDGVYAYHLATVLDDAHQGITHIVRGIDLLDVTPEQAYLRTVLQLSPPAHAHIPVLVDRQGQKLSKQSHAPAASTARPSHLLCRLLTLLKQNPPDDLIQETTETVLDWAIRHWDTAPLRGVTRTSLPCTDDYPAQACPP